MRPLENIRVIDFSTLLPGPLAGLILTEAGAQVIKIERPGTGDEMRSYEPKVGEDSVNFALLNAGKESIAIDLKASDAFTRLRPLIEQADIVIEQFRPGVMDRLGFGYADLKRINSRLIYCAITGWGQTGPKALVAAHDLNYMAEAGILGLSAGSDGAPVLPPVLAADIAGGAYPAVMNILLALRRRDQTGEGTYLDIAMGENLLSFVYWGIGNGISVGMWPGGGDALVTGGSPRYQIYATADGRYLAAAPLEEKFWNNFCSIIGLTGDMRSPSADPKAAIAAVAAIIKRKSAAAWKAEFEGQDVCCSIVARLEEAVADPHFAARKVFGRNLSVAGKAVPALPLPVADAFRAKTTNPPPRLGASTAKLLAE
ncbi:CaiB/BaiF CoA transferase family protein [Afipia birgiae]|jgi:alpha-methylacyl-CoA racemase|uniref:CaiB/BaiF CoA transferase family protein n=1 Tax=Afipia birgiae TaxID=151414 RepID=UPI0002EFE469|nr:CaiB/BaiF CoA-transferase family protein [Afipia birgiae]MBX9822277.1 CoA transferase [Afipia birgiae]